MERHSLNREFIQNWLENKLSEQEIAERQSKIEFEEEVKTLSRIFKTAQSLEIPKKRSKREIWQSIRQKVKPKAKVVEMKVLTWIMGIAASVLVLIGSYYVFYYNKIEVIEIGKAQTLAVMLPDNSSVVLNAESKISYYPNQWNNKRELTLEGEGFFEVEKGKQFKVLTSQGTVSVLGTSFNVFARNEGFNVKCFTGKVSVKHAHNNEHIVLSKGMHTEIKQQSLAKPTVFKTQEKPVWMTGAYDFQQKSLVYVFAEIERKFDVNIITDIDISNRIFTGYFTSHSLEEDLNMICTSMDLDYEIKNDNIITISRLQ